MRSNTVVPRRLAKLQQPVSGPADAMAGFDELDPRMRAIIHQAPMSMNARDALSHQLAFGADLTVTAAREFIRRCFPGWKPIEDHPNYHRASRPMVTRRKQR